MQMFAQFLFPFRIGPFLPGCELLLFDETSPTHTRSVHTIDCSNVRVACGRADEKLKHTSFDGCSVHVLPTTFFSFCLPPHIFPHNLAAAVAAAFYHSFLCALTLLNIQYFCAELIRIQIVPDRWRDTHTRHAQTHPNACVTLETLDMILVLCWWCRHEWHACDWIGEAFIKMTDKLRFGASVFVGKLYDFYHLSASSSCAAAAAAADADVVAIAVFVFAIRLRPNLCQRNKFIIFIFRRFFPHWRECLRFERRISFVLRFSHQLNVPSSILYYGGCITASPSRAFAACVRVRLPSHSSCLSLSFSPSLSRKVASFVVCMFAADCR